MVRTEKYYLMPDGRISISSRDEDLAHFICIKKHLISIDNATKNLNITNIQCLNDKVYHENFNSLAIFEQYNVQSKKDCAYSPNVSESCIRTVENIDIQKKKLKNFANTYNHGIYIARNDSYKFIKTANKKDSIGYIYYNEYTNLNDNNIRAILITVVAHSDIEELKKLSNYGFLQIYSAKKQVLISVTDICDKMKNLHVDDDDFFVRDFDEIQNDKNLELLKKFQKYSYKKVINGSFKNTNNIKGKSTFPDLVCQKYQYECKSEPNLTYFVLRIFETTDNDFQQFVGKCLVQKVDKDHQTISVTNEVLNFMQNSIKI